MKNKIIGGILLVALCVVVTGCTKSESSKESSIVGKWAYSGGSYVYTFNKDKSTDEC